MPAFGPTDAYREAAGFPREYGAWNWQQFQDWLNRANNAGYQGDWLRDHLTNFNLGRMDSGYASPGDIRSRGAEIMPVEDTINSRRGRLNDIASSFGDRPDIIPGMYDRYNDQAGDIVRTGDTSQDIIDRLYRGQTGREDSAHGDIVSNIADTDRTVREGINSNFGGLRRGSANLTSDIARNIGSSYGGMRRSNQDVTRGLRDDWTNAFTDLARSRGGTYGGLRNDLNSTTNELETGAQDTYGDILDTGTKAYDKLQGSRGTLFDDLNASGEDAMSKSIADAEKLNPLGDYRKAEVARSFAPAIANTEQRLRRAGIGANDMQRLEALSDVEGQRAAAMDRSVAETGAENADRLSRLRSEAQSGRERRGMANLNTNIDLTQGELAQQERNKTALRDTMERLGMNRYIRGENLALSELSDTERQMLQQEMGKQNLDIGQLTRDINLGQNELDTGIRNLNTGMDREINLGVGQSDRSLNQARDTGQEFRGEIVRSLGSRNAADVGNAGLNLDLANTQYGRTADWRNAGNSLDMAARNIWGQDWQTNSDLAREQNDADMTDLDLRNRQYGAGEGWTQNNYGIQDTAGGNLGNIMARNQGMNLDAARMAQQFGQNAFGAYGQTAQQEAGKGGWGSRLLGGLASAAAPFAAMIPGVGPFLSSGLSIAGGFGGSGGGGAWSPYGGSGQYGGGQGGGGSPYSFSAFGNTFQNYFNNQANQKATQAGYSRATPSTARVDPSQAAPQFSANPSWLQQWQQSYMTPQPYRVS